MTTMSAPWPGFDILTVIDLIWTGEFDELVKRQ